MGLSQPLNLGDRLREALAEARGVLENYQLQGKITLIPEIAAGGPTGLSGVESSMDRTAKDARDVAEKGIGGGADGSGPLNPTDRMVDAMTKLVKALEASAGGALGKRRGRRTSADGAGSSPLDDDDDGKPGYVNPYLLQGLIQNPIGTTQNSIMSMLMGGAGAGLKAPGWLMSMLQGSGGTFQPGLALGSETGLLGAGGAGTFASAGMIAASKVAVPVAAFAGTMMVQQGAAKDRLQDAVDFTDDRRFSQGAGFNWRAGAWDGAWSSRKGIWQKDAREIAASSGVGYGGMRNSVGDIGIVNSLNEAAESALRIGIAPGQMGSIIGAGVRSGTTSFQGGDATAQMTRYLALIEGWTSRTAAFGFSSNESLQKLAEVSQKGMMGTNLLTQEAQTSLLSMDARIRSRLPAAEQRSVGDAISAGLGAAPSGDTQTVLMMNQFLGSDGNLNAEGENAATQAFGARRVANVKAQYGSMAGTVLAQGLTRTDLGRKLGRISGARSIVAAGGSRAQAMFAMGSMDDLVGNADWMESAMDPLIASKLNIDQGGVGRAQDLVGHSPLDQEEKELAQLGQVIKRLSGLQAQSALSLTKFEIATTRATREVTNLADALRNAALGGGAYPQADMAKVIIERLMGSRGR